MKQLRRLILIFFTLFSVGALFAQPTNKGVVIVKLTDSLSRAPVEFATVSVTPKGQTTGQLYILSNDKGVAKIENVPFGEYTLKAELMGYEAKAKEIRVNSDTHNAGEFLMQEEVNFLDAASVSALGNPIIVKKDTIEYNASSFKVGDNDMLEELLKKLPGVEIDSDGKITANGKEINKITIDGKTFFFDDPQTALKNIPAKLVDKVKVVDKKSDYAEFSGIDDGQEETVIDLSVQPGMMRGMFGNVSGGYGTDNRYQTAGMIGSFTDKYQISAIGNGNNTNNRGFMDMNSDMGSGPRMMGGGSMFGRGRGITTSWMGGVTGNYSWGNKSKVEGSYNYGNTENEYTQNSIRTDFLGSGAEMLTKKDNISISNSEGHRMRAELDYRSQDGGTRIRFVPQAYIGYANSTQTSETDISRSDIGQVNKSSSETWNEDDNFSTSGRLSFLQRLGKPGRTLEITMNYSLSNSESNGFNKSNNYFYENDSTSIVNQKNATHTESYTLGGNISYTEPLGNNFFLRGSYNYSYRISESDKDTYNWNEATNQYDIYDYDYSNYFKNTFIDQNIQLTLMKQEQKMNTQIGISARPAYTKSEGDRSYENRVLNFAPSIRFRYNFSDRNNLTFNYNGRTNEPSITQLMPVPDNSNPTSLSIGNPELVPEFRHSVSGDYMVTNPTTFSTIMTGVNFSYTKDAFVNARWTSSDGITRSAQVNADNQISASARFMFNTPIAKSKFSINGFMNLSFSKSNSYNGESDMETLEEALPYLTASQTNNLSIRPNFRVVYRGESIEANINGGTGFSKAWYIDTDREENARWSNDVGAYVNWTLPAGFALISTFTYQFYRGYEEGYNEPQALLDLEISKLILKNRATLRVKAYDMLGQAKSINTQQNDRYTQTSTTNILGRYIMFSFTYRFGNFQNAAQNMRRGPGHGPGMMIRR